MKKMLHYLILPVLLVGCSGAGRIYSGPPEPLTCLVEDLPGSYTLISDLSGARSNEGLITGSSDMEASRAYIEATGRLDGWENRFMLMEATTLLPGFILCEAVVFESRAGAGEALHWPDTQGRQATSTERQIGEDLVVTYDEFNAPDGSLWQDYRVEFTYHNLLGVVHTYAPANIATADYALDLAEKMLTRFEHPPAGSTPNPAP